jgi:molybdopterin converting factor small subunit
VTAPVELLLPGALADVAGGQRRLLVDPPPESVAALLDAVALTHPALERRVRDETGTLRRYVNVYVDGEDVRALDGVTTLLRPGSQVHVLPSVAGG